jgi:tetratricopeptide (TPR) repeat protein
MTIVRNLSFILAATFLLAAWRPSVAQTPQDLQRLKVMETMVYTGGCAETVDELRDLAQKYPRSIQVYVLLKNALVCNKELDSALLVLDYLIKISPEPILRFTYCLDIAGVYLKKGETEKAGQQLQTALALAPNNPQTYEQASNTYTGNGYYPDAVKLLQDGRKKFGSPVLFAKQLGQLYEILRNYGDAAREYFELLAHDTTSEVFVTGKMNALIRLDSDEGFETGLKDALTEIAKQNPKNSDAQRFFGDLLMSQGKLDEAFQRFRLVDSLSNGEGKSILYFAAVARDNGNHGVVEKACDYLITRYPQSPFRIASRFVLGASYCDEKRYNDALAVYDQIVKQSPIDRDVSQALFASGRTRFDGLHDAAGALILFDRLIKEYPLAAVSVTARIAAADCHLALGQATVADSLYAAVSPQQLQQSSQEELLFKQAELQFYLGNFQQARDAYGKVMNTFPKSVYVNDCLRRIMLISEYPGMDEATLRIYADAAYAAYRFDYDSSQVLLDNLKERESGSLTEIAWYDAGNVDRELGKTMEALAQFDSLIARFPESFYAPLALECKGDIFADVNRDCSQAKATYESVLMRYPTSLNLENVRKKLQRVERLLCTPPEKPKS